MSLTSVFEIQDRVTTEKKDDQEVLFVCKENDFTFINTLNTTMNQLEIYGRVQEF